MGLWRCKEHGCKNNPREGKEFCPSHVEQHDYVREVIRGRNLRDIELARIKRGKKPDPFGLVAEDFLSQVRWCEGGTTTAGTIGRLFRFDCSTANRFAMSLADAGRLSAEYGAKGALVVSVTGPG